MTDVLIVGAGSAGSILAERLSLDTSRRVTVLESGPGFTAEVRRRTADATTLPVGTDSPLARHYTTRLTDHPPRQADIVRGDCAGGSGAINGGYFCRALPDDIAAIPGCLPAVAEAHYRAVEQRLRVRTATEFSTPTTEFLAAAQRCGHRWPVDLNAGADGVCPVPLNIADGTRHGPGAMFLAPALVRPNLTLTPRHRVTRVRFAGSRAVGVEALGPWGPVFLSADHVVLCAGAIASAMLLLRSGIGPGGPVADLPVGQSFADHPEWLFETDWPAVPGRPVLEAVLVTGNLEIRPYTTGFGTPRTRLGVALMRPRARGRLTLASPDPQHPPVLEHHYDSEPADLSDLHRGAELAAQMLGIPAAEPVWSTSQHLSGTAPMGSVVDEQHRLLGVEGLWVIDGSVLPRIPSRGPHATIAMLAHRAAEFF